MREAVRKWEERHDVCRVAERVAPGRQIGSTTAPAAGNLPRTAVTFLTLALSVFEYRITRFAF